MVWFASAIDMRQIPGSSFYFAGVPEFVLPV
jgi:hypothetical protein